MPVYAAVFMQNGQSTPVPAKVASATGVQLGKALDWLLGYINNGGILPVKLQRVSDYLPLDHNGTTVNTAWSYDFLKNVQADLQAIHAKAACGSGGVFYGLADSTYPIITYICNGTDGQGTALTAKYAGQTNEQILYAAWPNVFPNPAPFSSSPPQPATGAVTNLFAEIYNTLYVGPDEGSGRHVDNLTSQFSCSSWFAKYIGDQGQLPTASNNPPNAACFVPTQPTVCYKLFKGTGYFPDGNVFNCAGSNATVPPALINDLNDLGANGGGGGTYTKIKALLTKAQSNVYHFVDDTAYKNAFNAAGLNKQWTSDITDNAHTYPYGYGQQTPQLWHTIDYQKHPDGTPTQGGTNGAAQAYIVAHELGHVTDFNEGQVSKDVPNFNHYVQIDFFLLDYTNATGTLRLPCGTSGPFLNAKDSTGVAFCDPSINGINGVNAKWKYQQVGSLFQKPSDLLRQQLNVQAPQVPELIFDGQGNFTLGANPGVAVSDGWREWYAQSMAVRASSDIGGISNRNMVETLINNGYLLCIAGPNGWLKSNYITPAPATPVPSLPSTCTMTTLPGGWIDY